MLPRSSARALFVVALCCFTCSALAQPPGQQASAPGFSYGGKWIGYVPAQLKSGKRDEGPPVLRWRAPQDDGPDLSTVSAPHGNLETAGQEGNSPEASIAGPGSSLSEPVIVPTSFDEEALPPELEEAFVDQYEPAGWAAGTPECAPACEPQARCAAPWIWGRAEYLLWWTDQMNVPPLVTTSPAGTLQDEAGVLGQPDTSILFGNTGLKNEAQSGGRFTLGRWFDPYGCRAVEVTYMFLGRETERFEASSEGDPILARPFFNIPEGVQDAQLIAFDEVDGETVIDVRRGSILVGSTTTFQGAEVLYRRVLNQQCWNRLDFLVGYRFNRLDDELRIDQSFTAEEGEETLVPGTTVELFDLFDTSNEFHGTQLGVVFRERACRWSLEMLMKLGLGNTHSRAVIDGSTTITVPDADPDSSLGGLLALSSNIGVYERDHFAVIPELGVTLGYDVTSCLRATFGYTFIYWSNVARPGDLIDLDVNVTQFGNDGADLAGEPRPEFSWVTTDFWAQGLSFGLEFQF